MQHFPHSSVDSSRSFEMDCDRAKDLRVNKGNNLVNGSSPKVKEEIPQPPPRRQVTKIFV